MKRSVFFALAFAGLLCSAAVNVSAQTLLNEISVNPPGNDGPCEFIEIKGTPGALVENLHFASIEGDIGSTPGVVTALVSFLSPGLFSFGSNGLLVVVGTQPCGSRTYAPGTTVVTAAFLDGSAGAFQNGTNSFLLISSTTPITLNTDYDTDNNGTLEALPAGATIIDGIAWSDGGAGDITYGPVLTATGGTVTAASRFPNNNTPNSAAAWYAGALVGATSDSVMYSATIRTANFPVNGGVLTPGAPNVSTDAPVDIDGDAKTDYVVTRPAGGVGSQLTWHNLLNASGPFATREWGISGDRVIAGDYDGDGKDDETVWRPSNGTFYIIQSATLTARIEQFGQSGDNPRIVGDYDGDGRDDLAVYRAGATSQWFYKTSPTALYVTVDWGQTGDFPAPGDYDGDGRNDFVVQRPTGGVGVFWKRFASGTFENEQFGLSSDGVVPGDYDGDRKTDIGVFRTASGVFVWDFEPSGTPGTTVVSDTWGVPGDLTVQGDYDGDGKTDYAVWRPGSPATFFIMTVGDRRIFSRPWGQTGDTPVAGYNTF